MWCGGVILCVPILVKTGMKMEITFGERGLPCTAVDVSGNSLTGSGLDGLFLLCWLWRLHRWCVGSVQTVRLRHGPQFVWKGKLATDILHCRVLWIGGVGVGGLVLFGGLWDFLCSTGLPCLYAPVLPIQISHLFWLGKNVMELFARTVE